MQHRDARFVKTLDEATDLLATSLEPGDVLLMLGAGDGNRVGEEVLRRLAMEDR